MKELTKKFDVSQHGLKRGHVQTDLIGNAVLQGATVLSHNRFTGKYVVEVLFPRLDTDIVNGIREFKHLEDARRQFKITCKARRSSTYFGRALKMQSITIINAVKRFVEATDLIVVCKKTGKWTNVKLFAKSGDNLTYDITVLLNLFYRCAWLHLSYDSIDRLDGKWTLTNSNKIEAYIIRFIDAIQSATLYNKSNVKISYLWV